MGDACAAAVIGEGIVVDLAVRDMHTTLTLNMDILYALEASREGQKDGKEHLGNVRTLYCTVP